MNKVKIITDSCSDLTDELMEKYNIDYVKMNTIHNGDATPASLSWTPDAVHKFYDLLKNGEHITTIQVTIDEFNRLFTKYLEKGFNIIYIGCSSKQSGSVETANLLSKQLSEKFPEQKIYCIDSLNASIGEGILAIEAAKLVKKGKTTEEIVSWLLDNRKNINEFFTVQTLDFLKKSGKIKVSSCFLNNLTGKKSILFSDANGYQAVLKKVKGRENALQEIVRLMKDSIIESENQTIYITHADCPQKEIQFLVNLIKTNIPCKEIFIGYIGPVIGATSGPGAIGIWSLGKKITAVTD